MRVISSLVEKMRGPLGLRLVAAFFAFGTAMSSLTIILLLFPGTPLDSLWRVNPQARQAFASMGPTAIPLMLFVAVACSAAAIGIFRGKRWGRDIAIAVLLINVIGDTANGVVRHDWPALIGLPIAAALIAYLTRSNFN
jgi:predicted lysophospholipase L1 biosynthesis ABC-type transport system permease subunit